MSRRCGCQKELKLREKFLNFSNERISILTQNEAGNRRKTFWNVESFINCVGTLNSFSIFFFSSQFRRKNFSNFFSSSFSFFFFSFFFWVKEFRLRSHRWLSRLLCLPALQSCCCQKPLHWKFIASNSATK